MLHVSEVFSLARSHTIHVWSRKLKSLWISQIYTAYICQLDDEIAVLAILSWHSGRGGGARLWETVLWWWYVGFEAFEAWMYDEFDNLCTMFGAANPVFPLWLLISELQALRNGVIASRLFVLMPLWGMHFALGTFNRLSGILMRQDSHSLPFSGCLFASNIFESQNTECWEGL